MNWDAIGAVGEIIGAMAVVISVAYLAIQIRKQTDEAKMAATRGLAAEYHNWLKSLTDDEKLTELYLKAIRDYMSLEDNDRMQISIFFIRGFRVLEQQYIHTSRGKLDDSYFESANIAYKQFLTFPGVKQWWEQSNDMFEDGFRMRVEEWIEDAKTLDYRGSFGTNEHKPPNKAIEADA